MTRSVLRPVFLALLAACAGKTMPPPPPGPPVEHPTLEEIRAAGEVITEVNTRERLTIISHDSMGGRNTPSPGLEKVAQYLADNYAKWGLLPAGDNGTYFQRYPLAKTQVNPVESYLELREGGRITRYSFTKWAYPSNMVTPQAITGSATIISGAVLAEHIAPLELKGRVVIFVQDSARAVINNQVLTAIRARMPAAIVVLQNRSSQQFLTTVASQLNSKTSGLMGMPVSSSAILMVTAHDSLLADDNARNRPNWNDLRRSTKPVIMEAPNEFTVSILSRRDTVERVTAPNVVAMVPGSDPVLKNEYVVFSSHMDHVGTFNDGVGGCGRLVRADSTFDDICNGADDDGSGTTGVLSIAQAAAALKVKPKRTLVFVNVSGEEKGLLGSAYFAEHPTLPIKQVVANVNLDMIGRNATDSIVVIGKEHSDMGVTLATVQARHPELKLTASDDIWPEQNFYGRSDHFNFAKKGVPVLFFFNGTHPQYHRANDEVGLIDFSKLSRVARLGFYFAVEIANTPAKPVWNPESYQIVVVEQRSPPVVRKP